MNAQPTKHKAGRGVATAIILAALGYFVDIYDLILFGVVRMASLQTVLGPQADLLREGEFLLNIQMAGLLIGGLVWGVLGDRRGRLSVLFGSIFLYSAANVANAFAYDLTSYAVLRFIAGIGLAGELGAGITLVSELMSKEKRGYGATIVAAFGLLGAIAAGAIGKYDWGLTLGGDVVENWRIAYLVGGMLGFVLLALRIGVYESGMFDKLKTHTGVARGDLRQLFLNRSRFVRYLHCILIGLPLWFIIGVLVFQAPEFSVALGQSYKIVPADAISMAYLGLVLGDIACGLLSQWLRSRKKAVLVFLLLSGATMAYYLNLPQVSEGHFLGVCFALGFSVGYWAIFVTIAAEQFGTNLRATVTTTVPNFVRGALVPTQLLYAFLREDVLQHTAAPQIMSAFVVCSGCLAIALASLYFLKETFGKNLDYYEV